MTALSVTGSTSQAVGAFDALAASIERSTRSFDRLERSMASTSRNSGTFSNYVTAINSTFGRLNSTVSGFFSLLTRVGGAVQFVFGALLKELDKLQGFNAIMSVTTSSAETAAASYDFLRAAADRLGQRFDDLSSNYAKLVAALPAGARGLEIAEKAFMGVSMAARTLHASNADTQLMFYAITQMASKGVVSMEELRRQLGEKLPGVMQIAARAVNTVPEELEKAIRKGIVISDKFLPLLGDALIRTFMESSKTASESVSASINRLKNVWVDFVKGVLDSGAGNDIVGLFDALREKLSDPYLISRFAQLITELATRLTEFVERLTADDIRNGFDSLSNGISMAVTVMDKLITAITWVINNADKAGAILGGIMGASVGILGGPMGAAVGAGIGASLGGAAGLSVKTTPEQVKTRETQDALAQQQKLMDQQAKASFTLNAILPMLQNFKGINSLKGLERLTSAEMANTKTLTDLNKILTRPEYKTDKAKADAVREYAQTGVVLGPNNAKLADVLGQGKPKKGTGAKQDPEEATYLRAMGLDANFTKEFGNLTSLYTKRRLTVDQLTDATDRLIAKQPYMEEATRAAAREEEAYNRFRQQALDLVFHQVEVREEIKSGMAEELRLAGMRNAEARIETEVGNLRNAYIRESIPIKAAQLEQWREEVRLRTELQELSSIGDQILGQTVDRYRPAIQQQKAMDRLTQDPTSGFSEQDAKDFTINSDPNFQGSQAWLESQKRQLDDYYAYVDGLRARDRISEEDAGLAKARAGADYNKLRMRQTTDLFDTLAGLSSSGNKKLAAIGKAAAIAQATINAHTAITEALRLPFPMNYMQAAAIGLQAFARVRAIQSTGFQSGGYTGNGGESEVAGLVHGREYVVNAAATRRNRAALEAINAGAQIGGGAQVKVAVVVNNNSSGTQVTQNERDTPDGKQIEITIEDVVAKSVRRGGKVADAMEAQYGLNRAVGVSR